MRIVLTGGGTMGHAIPNVAIIEELRLQCALRDEPLEILYLGSYQGPEKNLIQKYIVSSGESFSGEYGSKNFSIKYSSVLTGKFRRYFSFKNFFDVFIKFPLGIFQAFAKIAIFRPRLVFSKGGYVSLPVCLAAWLLRKTVVMHESDYSPGLANRICSRFAKLVCLSYEESKKYFPKHSDSRNKSHLIAVTGNPIRKEVLDGDKSLGYEISHLKKGNPVLLIMGGSQGAEQINKLVRDNLKELREHFSILHIAGKGNVLPAYKHPDYQQFEFIAEDLKHFYAMTDFVITRGGANSLSEISALGIPALIIPLSFGASRGDQLENAKVFAKANPALVLNGEVNNENFLEAVSTLSKMRRLNSKKHLDAAKRIVEEILKLG